MSYELPPQARGDAAEQLAALRDYLVRLAQELDKAAEAGLSVSASAAGKAAEQARKKTAKDVREQARALKALIIKNANEITAMADERLDSFSSGYVAISDYGNYYEQIDTQVRQTARDTLESYHYSERIDALDQYAAELNGQIRRGVIEDPDTHEIHLGIAIGESLSFTGQTQEQGGVTYYTLSPGQTLGLYTSAGWQFWINGAKSGWFSSEDSMLHLANIVVENALQLGADWELSASGGFGLRYIGG